MDSLALPALIGFIGGHVALVIGTILNIVKPAAIRVRDDKGGALTRYTDSGKINLVLFFAGMAFVLACNFYLPYPCPQGLTGAETCFTFSDYILNLSGFLILIPTFFLPIVSDISGYEVHSAGTMLPTTSLDRVTYLFMFCGLALGILNTFHLPEVPLLIDFIANIIAFMATSFALLGDTVEHHAEADPEPTGSFKRFTPVGLLVGSVALIGFLLSCSTLIYTNKEQDNLARNIEAANATLRTSVTPLIDKVNLTLGTSIKSSIADIDRQSDSIAGKMQHIEQGFADRVRLLLDDPKNLLAKQNHFLHETMVNGQNYLKPVIDSMPRIQRRIALQTMNVREDLIDLEEELPSKIAGEVTKSGTMQALERNTRDLPSKQDITDLNKDMLRRAELKPVLDGISNTQAETRKELNETQQAVTRMATIIDKHILLPKTKYRPGDTLYIDDDGDIILVGRSK